MLLTSIGGSKSSDLLASAQKVLYGFDVVQNDRGIVILGVADERCQYWRKDSLESWSTRGCWNPPKLPARRLILGQIDK